jgi:hypothetical protein
MIKIERGAEIGGKGIFSWAVPEMGLEGTSRTPLLDACRAIKAHGGPIDERAGIYRAGRSDPDLCCIIADGAEMAEMVTRAKYKRDGEDTA